MMDVSQSISDVIDQQATIHEQADQVRKHCHTPDMTAKVHQDTYVPFDREFPDMYEGHWEHFIVAKGIEKLANGEDYKIAICGQTGRGKSMKSLRLAEIFHDKYNVCFGPWKPKNLCYETQNFLNNLSGRDGNPAIRQTLIFDEAAEKLNHANYKHKPNVAVRNVLNLQRVRQNIYIFVLPFFYELDVGIKDKIDVLAEVKEPGFAKVQYNTKSHGETSRQESHKFKKDKNNWYPNKPKNQEYKKKYRDKESRTKNQVIDEDMKDMIEDNKQELDLDI